MPRPQHYSPALDRFLVKALYHEARGRGIAMTALANQLLEQALVGREGWIKAQQETMQIREGTPEYKSK